MTLIHPKTAALMFICLGLFLTGCGRKPSLKDLEPLPPRSETTFEEKTASNVTIDGEIDGNENAPVNAPKKRFILDPLL